MTKVYCIFCFSTCCYVLNSAILVKGSFVNGNSRACKIDCTTCTIDGFNTSQSGVQCQTVAVNYEVRVILQLQADFQCSIFYGRSNTICTLNLNSIAQRTSSFIAFVIFQTEGLVTDISIDAVLYVIQLAAVYCIGRACSDCTCCYAGNLLIICVQTAAGNICFTFVAYAVVLIHEEVASFYAVYSQILLQRYLNIFISIGYFNISSITIEFNFITSFANSHSCLGATICSKFPACIHYLLQLFFCSSIAFSCKVCITNISIM